jgi:hypothetical protein
LPGEVTFPAHVTQSVLLGMIASVLAAYLIVANVFIFLNLRYEPDKRS